MKRYIIYFFVFVFLAILIVTINNGYQYKNAEKTLSYIMNQRTDIINQATGGQLNQEEAHQLLKQILDDPLLESDTDFIKDINDFPTDIDIIKEMHILEINDLKIEKNDMTFNAHIVWVVEGLMDIYVEESTYSFHFKKFNKGSYKLIDYQVIT